MEIEYSGEVRGRAYAYRFSNWEKKLIAKQLVPAIKKMEKKIERIKNNPKNEGQATYSSQVDELRAEIKDVQDIIKEFSE